MYGSNGLCTSPIPALGRDHALHRELGRHEAREVPEDREHGPAPQAPEDEGHAHDEARDGPERHEPHLAALCFLCALGRFQGSARRIGLDASLSRLFGTLCVAHSAQLFALVQMRLVASQTDSTYTLNYEHGHKMTKCSSRSAKSTVWLGESRRRARWPRPCTRLSGCKAVSDSKYLKALRV